MPIDNKKISVLIAGDSTRARRAVRLIFETRAEFRVVGEAATGRQAVEMAVALKPQIITMDLDMPEVNGLDAIEEIMAARHALPGDRLVHFSVNRAEEQAPRKDG